MTDPREFNRLADRLIAQNYGNVADIDSMESHFELLAECATALRTAAAWPDAEAVKVKPMAWVDHQPNSFPEPFWSAQTPFGFYNIEEVSASDCPAYVVRLHAHHFIADMDSLDEAKAAAQADYEARIKSALVEVPAVKGEPEPVAWPSDGSCVRCGAVPRTASGLCNTCLDEDAQRYENAPPAGAGMREAFVRVLASLAAAISILERTPKAKKAVASDKMFDAMLDDYRKALEAGRAALTAPGATTKSDGGCMADFSPDDPTNLKELMASKPVWSDPSSTRSDPNDQAYADLIASGGIFPEAYQQGEASMTDDQIKHMVDRFLMWKLPEHFNPDCGISFDPTYRSEHGPVGTNLFDAVQATAMVRHMLEGLPSTRREVTVEELARTMVHAVYPNSVGDRWFERNPVNLGSNRSSTVALAGEYACALLDQFEIRRK